MILFIFQIFFQKWLWRLFGTLSVDHNRWWLCRTTDIWRSNNSRMPKLFRVWLNDPWENLQSTSLIMQQFQKRISVTGSSSVETIVFFVFRTVVTSKSFPKWSRLLFRNFSKIQRVFRKHWKKWFLAWSLLIFCTHATVRNFCFLP